MAKERAASREPRPIFDRVPPQNIEAERAVLGAILLNPEAAGSVLEVLREGAGDLFYVEAHQQIYGACVTLFRKATPIDAVTVYQQLVEDGHVETSGGATYLSELTGAVPTSANVSYYAQIVLDAAILRRLIRSCTEVVSDAYEGADDVNEIMNRAESAVFNLSQTRQLNPITKVGDLLQETVERIENLIKSHSGISGLPTGFSKLDEMLSGLQKSDMLILAARPSVGKTAFALNIAAHVGIQEKKGVLLFSLEMSKEQLTQRLLCMEGRIDSRRLRTGFLAASEMSKLIPAAGLLGPAPIYIDDTPNITLLEMRSKTRRHCSQHEIGLIIIDYLQLMSSGSKRVESRQVEISEISRSIKGLAREMRVPVIALSQLSREAEKDDTGTPKLSHLRESGAIEQDADVVMMLSRPPKNENENENLIKVVVAKQRNGPTGELDLLFFRDVQRFESIIEGASPQTAPSRSGSRSEVGSAVTTIDAPFEEEAFEGEDVPF